MHDAAIRAIVVGLAAFAGVAYAATRTARNGPAERISWDAGTIDLPGIASDFADIADVAVWNLTEEPSTMNPEIENANVRAFLAAIIAAEGTDRAPDPYRVVMGYGHTLQDLSDHPYFTGEWRGASFGNGQWSTAAGAYQFIRTTWAALRAKLSLPDFGPDSQDAAAIELIRERGALEDVKAGRFEVAVGKVRRVWASLPGAGYGQGERSLAWLAERYQGNGGTLA